MSKDNLLKVSIIIMSFNGGRIFERCLKSIREQDYPQELVEIVVVDDASTDDSVKYAKKYKARIFTSGKHDMYLSWAIGLHKVTGDLVYMLDQDIEFKSTKSLRLLVAPLLDDNQIVASFTRAYPKPDQPWITRYISYHPFQCDPLYEFLTPPVEDSIIETRLGYFLCKFVLGKIPAESRMMYRVKVLEKTANWQMDRIFDHDLLIKTLRAGYDLIAYVPEAGIYHHHAKNLSHLIGKRMRNLTTHYFPYQDSLEYRWLDVGSKKDIMWMIYWVIYANLFFPAMIRGILRAIKYRDWVLLMEPIVVIASTDAILWKFLGDDVGRKILNQSFNTLLFHRRNLITKGAHGR